MNTKNENGPATVGAVPDPVQSKPHKEIEMNTHSNTTEPAAEATESAASRVDRSARELAHAIDAWQEETGDKFVAHVHAASSGRGIWLQLAHKADASLSSGLGDVLDTLSEVEDYIEAVWMAATAINESSHIDAIQRVIARAQDAMESAKSDLYDIRGAAL